MHQKKSNLIPQCGKKGSQKIKSKKSLKLHLSSYKKSLAGGALKHSDARALEILSQAQNLNKCFVKPWPCFV